MKSNLMSKFFQFINHHRVAVIGCVLVLFGLIFSRFLLSVGMIAISTRAILHPKIKTYLGLLWRRKDLLCLVSIFLLYLLSGLWSEDQAYFIDRMRMKVPFLTMPLAFVAMEQLDRGLLQRLFYFFFWMVALTALGSTMLFLLDFQNITESYGAGRVMPTPVHHIRFSLMVVFCICLGIDFYEKRFTVFRAWERRLTLVVTLFLVVFVHVLAVRSGLLALYGVVLFLVIRLILQKKKYLLGLALAGLFVAASWLSYQYIPTLKKKIGYTLWSVDLFQKKEDLRELSDSRRLGSILAAFAIAKENPLLGVGIGDIKNETNAYLRENYPDLIDLGLMPHNQFLFVLAACGGLGLIWFTVAIFWPLFYRGGWRDPLLSTFFIIVLSSFIVEHTLETQVGTAFYVFLWIMLLQRRELSNE